MVDSAGDFEMTWPHRLLPYQRIGVRALLSNPSLLLANEMGLGKTIVGRSIGRCEKIKECAAQLYASFVRGG
jgi:hypothetical protein